MRILFLSAYLPGRGLHGGSSRIFELLHYLHNRHNITLLTFLNRHDDESRVQDLKKMCQRVDIVPLPGKRPFYLFPFEPFIDYHSEEFSRRLEKILKKEKVDLVQYEYVQMGLFHEQIPHVPSVLTEHEINFLALQRQGGFITRPLRRIKNYYNSLQMMKRELEILRQMDRVICMNRTEAQALTGYLEADRLTVLPHGVDTEYFAPRTDVEEEPFTIGFFGAYHHYPNVDAVLHFVNDILPLVKERIPAAHFQVIGINPPPELETLGERPDVTVTGFVPDIRTALARCSVIAVPVRLGLGMRVKMLEAMSMGKPVVATDLACEGLDFLDGQHLIMSNKPDTFAESVCYLLQDRKCRESLGREARQLVEERYNYQSIGSQLENIYEDLI
ncbi:MAG: glycosyltransferase [Acidobacteria bacterium]|nr:glycosyltransferase [Acidobacteriota bacterium]